MKLGNLEIMGDLVLAPMAGVTDLAFRTICAELGAAVTVTEMVSSRALIYQDKKSRSLLHKTPLGVCGAQIFGNDPSVMADGAALALEHSGADFIDINMGCPAPKIVNNGDGSALMKDPELASKVIAAVVNAVDVPVTVKFRKGWDEKSVNCVEFAKMAEQSGAAAITLHGRTRSQQYSGTADWDAIRKVKEQTDMLVKLDTNGTHPDVLRECIAAGIDYVAMDIKSSEERYHIVAGHADTRLDKVKESISILLGGEVDYEFRTTAVKPLHTAEDFNGIGQLISGAKRYFIQCYKDSGDILIESDEAAAEYERSAVGTAELGAYSKDELESFLAIAKKYIPTAELRGVD